MLVYFLEYALRVGVNTMKNKLDIRSISEIAMMAAIVFVATYIIKIPSPSGTGYVNVGDSMVFLAAVLLGGKKGAIAAAIGGSMSDALGGYLIYAPFTLVIKAGMALIAGSIAYKNSFSLKDTVVNTFSFVIAGIFEVIAYVGAGIIVYLLTISPNIKIAITGSILDIPGNIVQVGVGIVIAVPMALLLKKSGIFFKKSEKKNIIL